MLRQFQEALSNQYMHDKLLPRFYLKNLIGRSNPSMMLPSFLPYQHLDCYETENMASRASYKRWQNNNREIMNKHNYLSIDSDLQ